MITRNFTVHISELYLPIGKIDPEHCVFFDIETTGFRASSSHLYLIGAAVRNSTDTWTITQWMAEQPQEEHELINAFSVFLTNYGCRQLVHFNGCRFDIPYLEEKYSQYAYPSPLKQLESIDLYRDFKGLKKFLKLTHMNQQALEDFLHTQRKDSFNGGELIRVYHTYCRHEREEDLSRLLLHNLEDVSGMLSLTALYGYSTSFSVSEENLLEAILLPPSQSHPEQLLLTFRLSAPVPAPVSHQLEYGYITLQQNTLKLLVPVLQDTLCYFFKDYKNYYYLPEEDQAIHKSVAAYTARDHRQNARPDNCYVRKSGHFLPEPQELFTPALKLDFQDHLYWFSLSEEWLSNKQGVAAYASCIINSLL